VNDQNQLLREAAQRLITAAETAAKHFGYARLGGVSLEDSHVRSELHAGVADLRAALDAPAHPQGAGEAHHWIVPDFGFLFPNREAAKRYLSNIGSKAEPTACYTTPPASQQAAQAVPGDARLVAAPVESYSTQDRAFHSFWYGHMLNEFMQPPLAGINHSTARYIWDAAMLRAAKGEQ